MPTSASENENAPAAWMQEEARLRDIEQRFRAIFDTGPVGVFFCNREGVVQDYNRLAAESWGREPTRGDPKERFCGSFKLYHPDGRPLPHSESPIVRVLNTGQEAKNIEVVIEQPSGGRVAVVVNFTPLKRQDGEVTGAIATFYDVTERRRAENALRASRARYESLLDAAPVGVCMVDAKFRIREINPKARPMFGALDELLGRDLGEVTHMLSPAEIADAIVARFRHTLETGEPHVVPEFSAVRQESRCARILRMASA